MSIKEKIKNLEYNNFYPLFFTLVFILILIQYSFNSLDALFYDLWTKADIGNMGKSQVVTITMDEESDQFLGEIYPYTYATHSRMLEKLLDAEPTGIGFLIPFLEQAKSEKFLDSFKQQLQKYQRSGGFVKMGIEQDFFSKSIFPASLKNFDQRKAILSKDEIYFAKDNTLRRAVLNIGGEESFHLSIVNSFLTEQGQVTRDSLSLQGSYYDPEFDASFALFRYLGNTAKVFPGESIPYHRVMVGNFPADYFKNKIVLIGSRYLANPDDFIFTPFGKEGRKSPRLNVHAAIIDSLIGGKTITEVRSWITDVIAILISLFLSFIISKVQPAKGLIITIAMMFAIFLITYLSFIGAGLWFKISHIILSIFVVYYIWVPFRAIGEYQTRYAIQEEAKVLKKVDKLKQNFISLMSHDLKTPVAKVAGIADILREQYDNSDKQNELLDNIVDSTKELNNFITSILDLTKVESREISLKLESRDINTLVETTINNLRFEANRQKMKITTDLAPLYPIKIDVNLINRVLGNIVGNAIKYAGSGSDLLIKTWDDESWVYLEISDSGKGINPEEIEHIFEKFYRVKNDDSHKIKGSGLGLYLVKYFIELHHGDIQASSELGVGTKFLIKLKNE